MARVSKTEKNTPTGSASDQQGAVVAINAQYIKDVSFENPHSPLVLAQIKTQPKVSVSIDIKKQQLEDGRYEVVLHIGVRATAEEKTVYLLELDYAALVMVQNVPEQNLGGVLMVHIPSMLFPFARRVVADLTREGGMMPLVLEPIDFNMLYSLKKQRKSA